MRHLRYILDLATGIPKVEPDFRKWVEFCNVDSNRIVAKTPIEDCEVSTVFLSLDHAFGGGPPILWETMVFGGPHDQDQYRCSGSIEQAQAMHVKVCALVEATYAANKPSQ